MSDLRAAIFGADDLPSETIFVPEWDVTLEVRGMNGTERGRAINRCLRPNGRVDMVKLYADLMVACVRDPETHELVFDPADVDEIGEKSGKAIENVAGLAARLSGISEDTEEDAKFRDEGSEERDQVLARSGVADGEEREGDSA